MELDDCLCFSKKKENVAFNLEMRLCGDKNIRRDYIHGLYGKRYF